MPASVAQKLEALWESNAAPPNVFDFLRQHAQSPGHEILSAVLVDQKHRWKSSDPISVEDYLKELPSLAEDSDLKLELAVGEYRARQASGKQSSSAEFAERFDDIRDRLLSQLSKLDSGANDHIPSLKTISYIQDTDSSERLGRYRIERTLGQGAFGKVYLAYDQELQRQVAIKVPTPERFRGPEDAEQYLNEARTVASLNHPNIVPVYDVGRTEDGLIYVVSKLIEGCTLDERLERDRPSHDEIAQLLAVIAQALHHAHQRRLIHRDIKPSNILLEGPEATPYVADFGLAIREDDYLKDRKIAGTPGYMSPEQARGEGHRLDGRSDLFSLGVVLYELLIGERPFRGSTFNEVIHKVITVDPRSPREIDDSIPAELERICLKSLAKRASDRYATGAELADDLLSWDQSPQQESKELPIVPKGLRSFDAGDADFFLDLLPGPRNRSGLPESVQFWKTRLEETDPEKTFAVGLIYGPSGCGKSSMVKAGLLPRLSKGLTAIYVEATPDETETRILRGLRKALPDLSADLGLVETFSLLRRGEANKVVVVLDQFEQWLHAHRTDKETDLVSALRQCDGGHLQAVVMVRDDFWLTASRFMNDVEVELLQGNNIALVDLFDIDHAVKVLVKFGQAFGKLPTQSGSLSDDENTFVHDVATGLAQDGKVVSVRLALFAEMVKGKPWVSASLTEVGGTEGIGVNFLEETFSSRTANPKHRLHQQAAREVLKALLPEVGSDIKGHMRSHSELLEASGYQNRAGEFNDLLRILDGELRLITPTDPEGFQSESGSDNSDTKYYQLTHDYLVPSLRDWLTRKQQETRKGRAELKLGERAALWNAKPENRHLPSVLEWLNIRLLTHSRSWSSAERSMMHKAGRVHLAIWGIATSILLIVAISLQQYAAVLSRESAGERVEGAVNSLTTATGPAVPLAIQILDDLPRELVIDELKERYSSAKDQQKLSLAYGLAAYGDVDVDELIQSIRFTRAPGSEVMNLVAALSQDREQAIARLKEDAQTATAARDWIAKTRLATAAMHLGETSLAIEMLQAFPTGPPAKVELPDLLSDFQQQLDDLESLPEEERNSAANRLARATANLYLDEPAKALADLNELAAAAPPSNAETRTVILLLQSLALARTGAREQAAEAMERLSQATSISAPREILVQGWLGNIQQAEQSLETLVREASDDGTTHYHGACVAAQLAKITKESSPAASQRLTRRAIQLLRRAHLELGYSQTRPDQDPDLIPLHQEPQFLALIAKLYPPEQTWDPEQRTRFIAEFPNWCGELESLVDIARDVEDPSFSSGISLAAGGIAEPSQADRKAWGELMVTWYSGAADSGTHGAARWVLRQWNLPIPEMIPSESPSVESDWWQTPNGLTMVRVPAGSITAEDEMGDFATISVGKEFWLCDQEVSRPLFMQFVEDTSYQGLKPKRNQGFDGFGTGSVIHSVSWYDAVMFCNWLSQHEGRKPCYQIVRNEEEQGEYDVSLLPDGTGYRLPTEAEWEYACRAMTTTTFAFGDVEYDLMDYCIYYLNAGSKVALAGTRRCNPWGLFDMHGNLWEWCWNKNNATGSDRVFRGGSWFHGAGDCRSADSGRHLPSIRAYYIGFRVACAQSGQ